MPKVLSGTTIFLSAFLLFSVEPLIAKKILPWFGGSAAVWSTCLVFFQTALLAGYCYARFLVVRVPGRVQSIVHIVLLAASLALLPVGPSDRWKPSAFEEPSLLILGMLTVTIGLPFVLLSATSPLLQAWLARWGNPAPYRLFALSNIASLAALLAYPFVIEPAFDVNTQTLAWSAAYACFAGVCGWVAWNAVNPRPDSKEAPDSFVYANSGTSARLAWFALAACGSMLLLSVTNHIDENVAAVPLLWVLPLAIYLLTFVFAFTWNRFYVRPFWLRLLAFALGILGYAVYDINAIEALQITVPIFLLGLFVCCTFCHGELNRRRPQASDLTMFYLLTAAGGAAGAIFVGLIAPHVFSGVYELPLTLFLTAVLALILFWNDGGWPVRALWTAVAACMAAVFVMNAKAYRENSLSLRRSFYGSLRVVQSSHAGPEQSRALFHGTIQHGAQFLLPPGRFRPTTYYGPDSGIGIVLREGFSGPKRVGVVGLGVGTLAAYGKPGDVLRFYEINPQVLDLARSLFFYLRETPATIQIVEGDARLSLEHDRVAPFDVLALDAFSGDAIPVHLLTTEAMKLYLKHLKPDEGVLAFHVSNNYLDLAPVVRQLAEQIGYRAVLVHNHSNDDELVLAADWVLVTKNRSILENAAIKVHSQGVPERAGLRPWTDSYNNLLEILKSPKVR